MLFTRDVFCKCFSNIEPKHPGPAATKHMNCGASHGTWHRAEKHSSRLTVFTQPLNTSAPSQETTSPVHLIGQRENMLMTSGQTLTAQGCLRLWSLLSAIYRQVYKIFSRTRHKHTGSKRSGDTNRRWKCPDSPSCSTSGSFIFQLLCPTIRWVKRDVTELRCCSSYV